MKRTNSKPVLVYSLIGVKCHSGTLPKGLSSPWYPTCLLDALKMGVLLASLKCANPFACATKKWTDPPTRTPDNVTRTRRLRRGQGANMSTLVLQGTVVNRERRPDSKAGSTQSTRLRIRTGWMSADGVSGASNIRICEGRPLMQQVNKSQRASGTAQDRRANSVGYQKT